jgi:hypothetical protein
VQLDFEFLVPVGPAGQQFRTDKNQPGRINLRDRNLDVVLLLPLRRNLPAVDHDGIATVPADESVTDLQPGTLALTSSQVRDVSTKRPPGRRSRDIDSRAAPLPVAPVAW